MRLQKATTPNTCLLTSFAMAMDVDQETLLRAVGSDPNTILWPRLWEPQRRRGHHIQELVDVAWTLGYTVTEIQAIPMFGQIGSSDVFEMLPITELEARVIQYLDGTQGVLRLHTHAVAWDGENVYDPQGMIYGIDGLKQEIESYYVICKR